MSEKENGITFPEWVRQLPDTGGEIRGFVEAPDGSKGFYEKKGGGFTYWPLGKGQGAGELMETLLCMQKEEKKESPDWKFIGSLSQRARKLAKPKPED